ncbi:Dynein assembly factor 3, axonemal [Dinochytrium kinnereticum]|nr:Dynein assembly factor 3, axonemal [Dinochytrium kinnereticum]
MLQSYQSFLVTGDNKTAVDIFNFSNNRFRDLDDLEESARFISKKTIKFDVQSLWDSRLRYHFGVRYDKREDAIDWDYHMVLSKESHRIVKNEYLRWRMTGQAFEAGETAGLVSNKTWASKSKLKSKDNEPVKNWTFVSDIVTGPFLSFGSDSEDETLLKKENDIPKYQSFTKLSKSNTRFDTVTMGYTSFPHLVELMGFVEEGGKVILEKAPLLAGLTKEARTALEGFIGRSVEENGFEVMENDNRHHRVQFFRKSKA